MHLTRCSYLSGVPVERLRSRVEIFGLLSQDWQHNTLIKIKISILRKKKCDEGTLQEQPTAAQKLIEKKPGDEKLRMQVWKDVLHSLVQNDTTPMRKQHGDGT